MVMMAAMVIVIVVILVMVVVVVVPMIVVMVIMRIMANMRGRFRMFVQDFLPIRHGYHSHCGSLGRVQNISVRS